jgi:hypothetical protein
MTKTQVFNKVADIIANGNRGDFWITFIQSWFNPEKILIYSGMIKILFPFLENKVLFIGSALFFFITQIIKIVIGKVDIWLGLWKKQNEYNSKADHLAPWNNQVADTLEEICKAVGANSKITKL